METNEWAALREDAVATLSRYVQFDTTNPPGNERGAAEWLKSQVVERGITSVRRALSIQEIHATIVSPWG